MVSHSRTSKGTEGKNHTTEKIMNIQWKDIKGYEGQYQVSNVGGMVKSLERVVQFGNQQRTIKERILKQHIKGTCLYPQVDLTKKGKQHWVTVHRLVAEAWVPNPNNYPQINHKDENVMNADASNLEWCDNTYNQNYGSHKEKQVETLKERYANGSIEKKTKPVLQYTMDGILVARYESVKEAGRAVNRKSSNISMVCKGVNRTAAGYMWRYVTEC